MPKKRFRAEHIPHQSHAKRYRRDRCRIRSFHPTRSSPLYPVRQYLSLWACRSGSKRSASAARLRRLKIDEMAGKRTRVRLFTNYTGKTSDPDISVKNIEPFRNLDR